MKHYTDRDFIALIDEIQEQEGRHLPERCMADELEFKLQDGSTQHVLGNGCEEDALFLVPYDPDEAVSVNEPILEPDPDSPKTRKRQAMTTDGRPRWKVVPHGNPDVPAARSTVRVCANDDLMRAWPRFRDVIQDRDPGA